MMPLLNVPIAITGSSAVSSAGIGLAALVAALREQRCCLQTLPAELGDRFAGGRWGKADQFKAADFMPPLKARKLDRGSQFSVAAAGLALADAGLAKGAVAPERIGIALGCGFGGIANSAEFLSGYFQQGVSGLAPMLFPNTVANAPASNTSIEHGLKGPNITFVQRFCSAESALLAACRFLEEGRADVMLAGGVDELTPLMLHGFAALGQLHTHAADFGEGCGLLVLERNDHAVARGARIKAVIGAIATVGLLLPGTEQAAGERLVDGQRSVDQLMLSGDEAALKPLLPLVQSAATSYPGRIVGRSLAMGGLALAALAELLQPGARGVHLAASSEGPYFSVTMTGGSPA